MKKNHDEKRQQTNENSSNLNRTELVTVDAYHIAGITGKMNLSSRELRKDSEQAPKVLKHFFKTTSANYG